MTSKVGSNSFLHLNKQNNEVTVDLSKHLINLMFKEPFYTRIYRSITKIETSDVPTAGVTIIDNNFTLFWNKNFLSSLTPLEVSGLLKHEALHLVFGHVAERRRDPHIVWNYSTDLAINSLITQNELPKGGLIPGVQLPKLTEEEIENISDKQLKTYNKFSKLISDLPSGKTSEYYFDILSKSDEVQNLLESGLFDTPGSVNIEGFDSHSIWDDISNEEADLMKAKLDELIKDATKEGESKGWGSVPGSLRKNLIKRFSRQIDWASLLRRFCGHLKSNERTSSIKRLNRKYPGVHPGVKKNYKPKINVYVDESGSMSDDVLEMLYGELESLSKHIDFYIYKFDTRVDENSKILWKKGKRINLKRNLCGGTCFRSATTHAIKNKSNINGYIIMTDGCAAKPQSSNGLRRAWILTPKCKLAFEKDNLDTVINMN